jgi:hypothetical protein
VKIARPLRKLVASLKSRYEHRASARRLPPVAPETISEKRARIRAKREGPVTQAVEAARLAGAGSVGQYQAAAEVILVDLTPRHPDGSVICPPDLEVPDGIE